MKTMFSKITFMAILAVVLAFTFSCSSDDNNGKGDDVPCDITGYRKVTIGDQIWMAENLNCKVGESKCYDNAPANCDKYGRLYNWKDAMKACPEGWHLPSNADWDKLFHFADGTSGTESPYISAAAGSILKSASGWSNEGNGEDTYDFSALPGGGYSSFRGGYFRGVGDVGYWWSASEFNSSTAYDREMSDGGVGYGNEDKSNLFSVRCLQD